MRKILCLLPNKQQNLSGIYKYNVELIGILKKNYNIRTVHAGNAKSYIITLIYKFIYLPFFLLFNSNKFDSVLYPEEGFAFLRIFSFSKKNNIIVHDFRKIFNLNNKILFSEKIKQIYLNVNYLFLFKFSKVIVPSYFTKNLIVKHLNLHPKKTCVIPNIINFKDKNSSYSDKFKIIKNTSKKFVNVMCITSNETRKNLTFLNKIIETCENINFIIIGDIKKKLSKNNVSYFKKINERHLIYLFKNVDFFLDVSLFEGFGRTLVEAQSFGIKVICFKTKNNREILKNSAIYIDLNTSPKKIVNFFKKKSSIKQKNNFIKNAIRFSPSSIYKNFKKEINEI